ncbi:diguanylate cyclase [Acidovorax sp. sic0104]|uniref:diguanylate cyclase n=1 Tax=Acidovorax sp. sic0104 TaxID=2854784 RepID=UPI0027153F21|nr:diguanylate cyclase [Acidovorax sp. sic0104]
MHPPFHALQVHIRGWHAHCSAVLALLWLLMAMALPLAAQAGEPLVLSQTRPQVNAWDAITLKADPTYKLSVQDMLARLDEFQEPPHRGGSLGVHKAAIWLHVPLIARTPPRTPWVVDIGYSSLQADIYLASGGEVLQQARTNHPGESLLTTRAPAMAFDLQAGRPYDLLIRVQATGPLILPITVGEMPYQLHEALGEQMLQGLLNGLALCLIMYSLIQWATQRDPMFGFYALLVLGSAVFSLQFFGLGAQFLWPDSPWMGRYAGLAAGLVALTGSFLFLGHALGEHAPHGRYARTMRAGAVITAAVCAALVIGLLSVPVGIAYLSLVGVLPSLISLPCAIERVRHKDPIGATLLVAWTVYGVGAAGMVCLVQGWVPANFWTLHSFQFGATMDMLLFFHVLGLRAKAAQVQAQETRRERDLMRSLAYTDHLTGLSNRRGLQNALHAALVQCSSQRLVAVYLMDLDGFKPVNDAHGHDVGDDLLVAVAHRLQRCVRHKSDVVARLGGDEFIIMAQGLATPEHAHALGLALLRAFEQPFTLSHLTLHVGLTAGYAVAPLDGVDPQGLIRLADTAMYAGKQDGKRTVRRGGSELVPTI